MVEIVLLVIVFAVLTLFSTELVEIVSAIWARPFWRHTLLMLILALIAFSFQSTIMTLFGGISVVYLQSVSILREVLGDGTIELLFIQSIVLFCLPAIVAVGVGVPLYYFQREKIGYAVYVLWCAWFVLVSLLLMAGS